MGYLLHIILALAALGVVESGASTGLAAPLGVLVLGAVPFGLQIAVRRQLLRGRFRSGELLNSLLGWSSPLLYFAAVSLFGWTTSVERWTGVAPRILEWPHPVLFLALAPFVFYVVLAIDARARLAGTIGLAGARRFHVRMFLTGLAPIMAWVLFASALGVSPAVRANLEEVSAFGAGAAIVLFAVFIVALPWVMQYGWDTRPLPKGVQREVIDAVARHVGFRCRAVLVWGTAQQMANAAVVGIGARLRVVLLSDALLAQLPERELVAVFAHEVAHVQRRHVLTFLASALGLFTTADLAIGWAAPQSDVAAGALVLAVFVVWYLAFGWLSRRFELDADLWSAEVTGDPAAMISALERVGSPHGRKLSGWRHFSTEQRSAVLLRAAEDPAVSRRLRALLGRVTAVAVLLMAGGLAGEAWVMARDFASERLRVDLRLGEYARAERRLESLPDSDEDVARLVRRARALGERPRVESLVDAARQAWEREDEEAAGDYAQLLALRGVDQESVDALRTGSR